MAESPSTTLTPDNMQALADRLYSRGVSKLFDDSPSMQIDLRHASQVIRALLSKIDHVAGITGDVTAHLRNLRITIVKDVRSLGGGSEQQHKAIDSALAVASSTTAIAEAELAKARPARENAPRTRARCPDALRAVGGR